MKNNFDTNEICGFLPVNKPTGISSFDCIRHIKKFLGKKTKIGHCGTLDNFASGLIIICISRQATKLVDTLMNLDKTYIVKAKLGELTDTLDYTGEIIKTKDIKNINQETLEKSIQDLGNEYEQIPPIYSALKYKGKPLYKLARNKKIETDELETIILSKKKLVQLYEIKLLEFKPPFFSIKTKVSKGTYVRSLMNDIAQNLGNFATCHELERTAIGPLTLENTINLRNIENLEIIKKHGVVL